MEFEILGSVPAPEPSSVARPEPTPHQRGGTLIRANPVKSSLEDCIEMVEDLRHRIEDSARIDPSLLRELRVWEERRLELEERYSREEAAMFWPPGMDKDELIGHLEHLLELANQLK